MAHVLKESEWYFGSVHSVFNHALLSHLIGIWGGHNELSTIHSIQMFIAELIHGTNISLSFSFYSQSERNQNYFDVQIFSMNTLILRERSLERIR